MKCNYEIWEDYPVVDLNINDLHRSINIDNTTEFYKNLKKDIIDRGLNNPILVVKTDLTKYKEKCEMHSDLVPLIDYKPYIVYGGSNRHLIAEEIKELFVPCVVVENFDRAWELQFIQRGEIC